MSYSQLKYWDQWHKALEKGERDAYENRGGKRGR